MLIKKKKDPRKTCSFQCHSFIHHFFWPAKVYKIYNVVKFGDLCFTASSKVIRKCMSCRLPSCCHRHQGGPQTWQWPRGTPQTSVSQGGGVRNVSEGEGVAPGTSNLGQMLSPPVPSGTPLLFSLDIQQSHHT